MGLPEGKRHGDSLLLLSDNREIASDDLWAIRALPTVWILGTILVSIIDPSFTTDLGQSVNGMVLISLPLYWLALRLFSSPVEVSSSDES